jgi:ferredoxin
VRTDAGGGGGMSERLELDPIACDGHGLCAELFPEGIELDDWGYPILLDDEVQPELREHALRAARACPALALRLRQTRPRR